MTPLGIAIALSIVTEKIPAAGPTIGDRLLLETDDFFLLETDDFILLE